MDSGDGTFDQNRQHMAGFVPGSFQRDLPLRNFCQPMTMNPNELSNTGRLNDLENDNWSGVAPQPHIQPRPSNNPSYQYYTYPAMPAWDSSAMPVQSMPHNDHQQFSDNHGCYGTTSPENGNYGLDGSQVSGLIRSDGWTQKFSYDERTDIRPMDTQIHVSQACPVNENTSLDLRYGNPSMELHEMHEDTVYTRRMSGSSFTLSTTDGPSEMQSYEDFSTSLSGTPSFTSEYPAPSNRTSLMSSTHLSPVASPRMTPHNRSELVRTQSRGRASPSPRPTMRSAPYSIDKGPNKRWSTGSYAATPARRPSPFIYSQPPPTFDPMSSRMSESTICHVPSRNSSPLPGQQSQITSNIINIQHQPHPYMTTTSEPSFQNRPSMLLPSHAFREPQHFQSPPPMFPHGVFRMLQSNADPHTSHTHYADLSDPPDLYASIHEEQLSPPETDMNPTDPDLVPHEQELRFDGDLYTPRWVRGHGNKREGWCGICKPGRWLVLKNSAFWYDKSFTHGISAATGSAFQEPLETRRMDGNADVWEGLCGSCGEWVALVSSKKKGTTWFRHAYKCHTHPKIKDAPKRRRESSHARAAQNAAAKPKIKAERPMTPQVAQDTPMASMITPATSCSQSVSQYDGST